MIRRRYPAKVLLFGEYLLLKGGAALAIPYPSKNCYWEQRGTKDPELGQFLQYLMRTGLSETFDLERMKNDLEKGWSLSSTIPRGSGLGSSGAVVAAIYDRYATGMSDSLDDLQSVFSKMEQFMHGKSSGFDPLTSYLGKPVMVRNNQVTILEREMPLFEHWKIELVNSGIEREASVFIQKFMDNVENDANFVEGVEYLTKLNNKILDRILNGDLRAARKDLWTFSKNQLQIFSNWIPDSIAGMWKEDLNSGDRIMKLLGAGGGGCFLRIRF